MVMKLFRKGEVEVCIAGEDLSVERFLVKYGYVLEPVVSVAPALDGEPVALVSSEDVSAQETELLADGTDLHKHVEVVEEKPKKRSSKKASKV
jgi:hypothetical protein